ncbi:MAG: preprotein translocase subunit SecG [Candidatus Melainabacteria bacterium GWA2_34_9]|nr:MAG: preprotein translocase subunit SecG [Candidatus Melainabacteria bacterium GWA2_34_9]
MIAFFQILQTLSGLLLILLVLIHSPKGDGMGSIGGAAQLFSSQKGVESGLNKITSGVSFIFIYVSLVLGYKLTELTQIIGSFIILGGVVFLVSLFKKFFMRTE